RPSSDLVVPTVVPLSICVTLDNDGASVIEQHVLRHAPEIDKGLSQAAEPGVSSFISGEPHPTGSAVPERRDKGQQGIATTPDMGEISLHLLTGRRLETHDRLGLPLLAASQKLLQLS